jgi:tetratricopeptide (TPR) repeat protein
LASSSTIAFGQYLRTLRERRGLSLDDVATLSRTFADPVEKGYLSRCENGHQSLALSKMIALSRIYEVPAEVLVERLELDLEVEKLGGPDTAGRTFKELLYLGVAAARRGTKWEAYGYFRDAMASATGPVIEGFRDAREQHLCACMNFSTAAAGLGRNAIALFELLYIEASKGLSQEYEPSLYERLSRAHRAAGDRAHALECADRAIALAEQLGTSRYLGYTLDSRARLAEEDSDLEGALRFYQRAFDAYTAASREPERAITLLCIGDVYFRLNRHAAARRALLASQKIAAPLGQLRTLAHIELTLGDLQKEKAAPDQARAHWRNGLRTAHELRDHGLKFKAEFRLFKQALEDRDASIAEPLARRLRKLAPWVPSDSEELKEFRALYTPPRAKPRLVARTQQGS